MLGPKCKVKSLRPNVQVSILMAEWTRIRTGSPERGAGFLAHGAGLGKGELIYLLNSQRDERIMQKS